MGVNLYTCVIATVAIITLQSTATQGVQLKLNPKKCISFLHDSVDITCSPSTGGDGTKDITLIEITRNHQDPIAFVRDCSNVTFGAGTPDRIQAVGQIDKDSSQSYLTLTVKKPKSEDTGVYTCVIYYVDQAGHLTDERTSEDLVVEKLDVGSLEIVIDSLKDKIAVLENKTSNIKEGGRNETNTVTAFSATRKLSFTPTTGDVVVFSDVLLRLGNGYDELTGVFTAPVKGLYVFNLVIRMESSNYRISIDLKSNNEVVSRLYAGDRNYADQSAISSLINLDVGDEVKPVVDGIYGSGTIKSHPFNSFSGYLLKTL